MKNIRTILLRACAVSILLLLGSCASHQVTFAPIEIKPIHMFIDIKVKADGSTNAVGSTTAS